MKIILIVDDEYAVADALEMVLTSAGYRVVTAGDGVQAGRVMDRVTPDLVLLDFMMPIINGLEVLALMRARMTRKHIPVVMMSGVYPDAKQEASGWTKWLDKPFQFDELLSVVAEIIGPGRSRPIAKDRTKPSR